MLNLNKRETERLQRQAFIIAPPATVIQTTRGRISAVHIAQAVRYSAQYPATKAAARELSLALNRALHDAAPNKY